MKKLVFVITAFAAACTHTHAFDQAPPIKALPVDPFAGRVVAVDVSGVPESYTASAGGNSYVMTGVRSHAYAVIRGMLQNDRVVGAGEPADVTMRLLMEFDLSSTMIGTECTAKARCEFVRDGAVVSAGTGGGRSDYPTTGNGGRNCELASLHAMAGAVDAALAAYQ